MLEYAGTLVAHLIALRDKETGRIEVRAIHSLQYSLADFPEQILELESQIGEVELDDILKIDCILGIPSGIEEIMNQVRTVQRKIYQEIADENDFCYKSVIEQKLVEQQSVGVLVEHIAWIIANETFCKGPLYALQQFQIVGQDENLIIHCLGFGLQYEDSRIPWMQEAVTIWLEREKPQLLGKQVVINSFLLKDLRGRRIIGALPDVNSDGFFLLVEGGKKVWLENSGVAYIGEQIGYRDINKMSINDVSTILQNPIYAYGIFFQPYEVFEEWQKVFQYVLAILPVSWDEKSLQKIYEDFLDFMKNQICECMDAQPFISKKDFLAAYKIQIDSVRRYLQCEEEDIISKDWLLLMRSRYVYLDKLYMLTRKCHPDEISSFEHTPDFDLQEFRNLLEDAEKGTSNEKGIVWEKVAEYMLERTQGLRVNGKRLRVGTQEIDLCCVNLSLDELLWNFGALILVECKNLKEKGSVSIIRNIGQIMRMKGTTTTLLFSKNGMTEDAIEEIRKLALMGQFVLCITKKDLLSVIEKSDFYNLLIQKWLDLEAVIADDLGLLG